MKHYSTVQAAKLLGVGRDSLYRWMRAGKIKGTRVVALGGVRIRLWTERDLEQVRKFMEKNYWKGRGRQPKKQEAKREDRT